MLLGYIDPGTGFTITSAGGLILIFLSGALGALLIYLRKLLKFIKKHKKLFLVFLLIVIFGGAGALFMMKKNTVDFKDKVVILGLDGLSPDIIDKLIAEGRLPNFKRLKEMGSYSPLATTNPPQSPVAWTGFSTGKNPGKNGVCDFILRDPKNYGIKLSLSNMDKGRPQEVVRSPRFWQYHSERGVPSSILFCPVYLFIFDFIVKQS